MRRWKAHCQELQSQGYFLIAYFSAAILVLGRGNLPFFAPLVSTVRVRITLTPSSVPKVFWECNGASTRGNNISIFYPLFSAVLDVDLAKEQPVVLPLLPSGMDPIACRHFHVLEEFCSLSFSDWLAFGQHQAQASVVWGPLGRRPVSTVFQPNSPSGQMLCGYSGG